MKLIVQMTELQLSLSLTPDMWMLLRCHSSSTHASQPHVQFSGTVTTAVVSEVDRLSERVGGLSPPASLHSWKRAASSEVV